MKYAVFLLLYSLSMLQRTVAFFQWIYSVITDNTSTSFQTIYFPSDHLNEPYGMIIPGMVFFNYVDY